jgi:hypothetical protein
MGMDDIHGLNGYRDIKGMRGMKGLNINQLAQSADHPTL